jgi:DNA-binding NarL/FixJ family response regulator
MSSSPNRPPITMMETGDANSCFAALTPRGRDVLRGILSGHSNKMIAHALGISPRTVEVHRARMMRDLGARHVSDAIRLAFEAMGFHKHAPHDTPGASGQKEGAKLFVRRTWR